MSYEIRKLVADELDTFRQAIASGFGEDLDRDDEQSRERFKSTFDQDRMYPVYDGDDIVGTGGDFELTVTVPGGAQVPMSGLTIITVQPTHTRQGILTAMMRRHIDMARERGEPLGGLWASEVPIYGRFGYGPAVSIRSIKYDARQVGRGEAEVGSTVRLIDAEEAAELLPPLFAAVQAERPGMFQRSETWWKYRLFYDPEKYRDGASALRHALAEVAGEPAGYMTYRQKANWEDFKGEVRIREIIATSDAAYRGLWHYASNIDLFPIVKHWDLPVDDPLDHLFNDGRGINTTSLHDSLWIRLIDVLDALGKRTYSRDGGITISLSDAFAEWNEGTYRLEVDGGVGSCERVSGEGDVAMDVATLGALYLGGSDARGLARVGRIAGGPEAISLLDMMFRGSVAPWCAEIF
ncbi:MAG: GNAT family N-acetyltransferase [Acidimicrobiia bacterium]|nr:GNAT family N-acetyltransferase [Acidimicrobiia bacterium]